MTLPTIHRNGTAAIDLLEGYMQAMNSMREAINKLEYHASPNGRDYYPQGPQAIGAALEEHQHRLLALRNVLAELETIATHVSKHA